MASKYLNYDKADKYDKYKFVGFKIVLYPTKEQELIFNRYFGACRFIYNKCIELQEKYYTDSKASGNNYTHLQYFHYSKLIIALRKTPGFEWLMEYNLESLRAVSKDVLKAYDYYTNNSQDKPAYKSKKNTEQSFPIRSDRLSIYKDRVKIPSIGYVSIGSIADTRLIGSGNKDKASLPYKQFINARVLFDGYRYYLTFSLPKSDEIQISSYTKYNNDIYTHKQCSDTIGIDIGCSKDNWIVASNGMRFNLPDMSKEEKKIKTLRRKYMHKVKLHNEERTNPYYRTNNEKKLLRKINKYYKRIKNKTLNKLYVSAHTILQLKPSSIVLENIRMKDMLVHRSTCNWPDSNIAAFNNNIHNHMPYTVKSTFEYLARNANINVLVAPCDYPSSQICSNCGCINKEIGHKKIFKCPVCGFAADRDDNASINLRNYSYSLSKPFMIIS